MAAPRIFQRIGVLCMKKKDKMKMLVILLLILTAVAVVVTFIIVSRLSHPVERTISNDRFEKSFSGILENVYIKANGENEIIVLYDGKNYIARETAADNYTGVADIELSQGKITKIYAKSASIKGTLTSYSETSVQIEGYEPLACSEDLPVYFVTDQSGDAKVRQTSVKNLVIGNSQVELVVADGQACAIVQHKKDKVDNIRVLLKNGTSVFYPDICITSDSTYQTDGASVAKKKVTSAKDCLKNCKNGKEIRIHTEKGQLYLCDAGGKIKKSGYAGDLILRKEKGGYVLINELPIEEYVRYVLPSEMPVSFSYEALKAQAVCARTFAYRQMRGDTYAKYGANLDDTTAFQVYHATETYEITNQAVEDTKGLVLTYNGKLIDCYYYSTSSGYSENLEVWDAKSPGYLVAENNTKETTKNLSKKKNFHKFITQSVESYDCNSPYYRWTATLSGKLGMDEKYGRLKSMKVNERSESGYILSLTVVFEKGERTYEKENDIRFALGKYLLSLTLSDGTERTDYSSVPSACFEVKSQKNGKIVLTGGGFGHGIGLSQYGADSMGKEGKNWQEILCFYYHDVTITDVFDLEPE